MFYIPFYTSAESEEQDIAPPEELLTIDASKEDPADTEAPTNVSPATDGPTGGTAAEYDLDKNVPKTDGSKKGDDIPNEDESKTEVTLPPVKEYPEDEDQRDVEREEDQGIYYGRGMFIHKCGETIARIK